MALVEAFAMLFLIVCLMCAMAYSIFDRVPPEAQVEVWADDGNGPDAGVGLCGQIRADASPTALAVGEGRKPSFPSQRHEQREG